MAATEITLRVRAEEQLDITPLWDSVITQNATLEIDWALAGPAEAGNIGGLQATKALHTAIILCIWTDKWSKANEVTDDQDPRGWWGDSLDQQGFPELGSELWSLFRGRLNAQTAMKAESYIKVALQTLIDQGAVARFDVTAEADIQNGALIINIAGYSQNGSTVYNQLWRFAWTQLQA